MSRRRGARQLTEADRLALEKGQGMTIGSGIAVAAIWGCAAVSMVAPRVSGIGMCMTLLVALIATIAIVV